MNFIFLNQYFPPDEAPTGLMLERVTKELVEAGHYVTILCAKGGYAESGKKDAAEGLDDVEDPGLRVVRIRGTGFGRRTFLGKISDYACFYLGVVWHLTFIRPKPDRIVALTTPPYLSILARFFSKIRGGDHCQWVMDLYPDVLFAHGMLKPKGVMGRFLSQLARWGFGGKRCKMVLTLGPDMEARITKYLTPSIPREWVPLWGTAESSDKAIRIENVGELSGKRRKQDELILMYSGNMGLGHRFGEFLEVAANTGEQFQWKFHGQGKRRVEVEESLKENPMTKLTLGDYVPREELSNHLAAADVHLASLDPVWDGTMVPSKLQGIFAIGRPVIFVGSKDCAMGTWIQESDGGWVVAPGDIRSLKRVINESLDSSVRKQKGLNAQKYAKLHFHPEKNSKRIAAYLSIA